MDGIDPLDMDITDMFFNEFHSDDASQNASTTGTTGVPDSEFLDTLESEPFPKLEHAVPVVAHPEELLQVLTKQEEAARKKALRRAQIAASGRRGRAKRKREKMDLEAKNKKLAEENLGLQTTIAELQFEMQRAASEKQQSIYELENMVLKKQVTEHRQFVDQVQRLMRGPDTDEIQRKRLIQQGSNSAVAQLLGLLYASLADQSWKDVKFPQNNPMLFRIQVARYQYLPLNSPAQEAKRLSLRADFQCPAKPKHLAKVLWDSCFETGKDFDGFLTMDLLTTGKLNDVEQVESKLNEIDLRTDSGVAKVVDESQDSDDAYTKLQKLFKGSETTKIRKHVQVKKGKEGKASTFERLSVVTIRSGLKVQVPYYELNEDKAEEEEVIVVATIASDALQKLTQKEESVTRDAATRITGYVFRNRPNSSCLVSVIWSKPILKDGWVGLRPQDEVAVFDDGKVNERFARICKMFMDGAIKQANELDATEQQKIKEQQQAQEKAETAKAPMPKA